MFTRALRARRCHASLTPATSWRKYSTVHPSCHGRRRPPFLPGPNSIGARLSCPGLPCRGLAPYHGQQTVHLEDLTSRAAGLLKWTGTCNRPDPGGVSPYTSVNSIGSSARRSAGTVWPARRTGVRRECPWLPAAPPSSVANAAAGVAECTTTEPRWPGKGTPEPSDREVRAPTPITQCCKVSTHPAGAGRELTENTSKSSIPPKKLT
jgi:hypothetical protein